MSDKSWITAAAGGSVAVAGVIGIALWFGDRPKRELGIRLNDVESEALAGTLTSDDGASDEIVDIEGTFEEFKSAPMGESSSWPHFRGVRNLHPRPSRVT